MPTPFPEEPTMPTIPSNHVRLVHPDGTNFDLDGFLDWIRGEAVAERQASEYLAALEAEQARSLDGCELTRPARRVLAALAMALVVTVWALRGGHVPSWLAVCGETQQVCDAGTHTTPTLVPVR